MPTDPETCPTCGLPMATVRDGWPLTVLCWGHDPGMIDAPERVRRALEMLRAAREKFGDDDSMWGSRELAVVFRDAIWCLEGRPSDDEWLPKESGGTTDG
jgi:hypothetical protein